MYRAIVFAGTTEGYEICRFLSGSGIPVCACVATDYGSRSLGETLYLKVQAKRLSPEEMEALFVKERPELVLDATHPYAAEVTRNIQKACENTGFPYYRILREKGASHQEAVYVESTEDAINYLNQREGAVFLTTGSKELAKYTAVNDYKNRLYARVLSLPSVMNTCAELGFEGKHLIGMQGPFSKELNIAMLRQTGCSYLVTKDTGNAGGFEEKIQAALVCGVTPVIIGRPMEESGLSLDACKRMLIQHFSLKARPQVTLLGIGMGNTGTLTLEGQEAVREADLIIGAKRMADAIRLPDQAYHYEYRSDAIAAYIQEHPEYARVVIALSGDVGFYSGAKKLLTGLKETLTESPVRVICGISSVVYFMAKIGLSWDDAKIVSAHGRECNLVSLIRHHKKVFAILGTKDGTAELAKKLVYYGMGDVLLYVGENLSYENEKLFVKLAAELTDYIGDALSVVCAYHESAQAARSTHGLPDEAFIRGKAPMTKEEVRTVSLSKLQLTENSVCYDVGAGTGSVSIEMALRASQGRVYAIEKKEEAVELLHENKRAFAADHLEIISGTAPDAMQGLPAPTHAFIGGSSGNLEEIVSCLTEKNPDVRIVINCITLETVAEALQVLREQEFSFTDIVQL
ncbi:MAG: precorrin-6A reductase, partial [Blautia sp.]|nr:precorrin-6A reductase [Blautia sp.]